MQIDKFIFVKEGTSAVYGVSFCVVDTAASTILAEVTAIDTYKEASMHKKKNGESLPRKLWDNIDGSRSQQYTVGKSLPSPLLPRIFESWRCWKKIVKNDVATYLLAFTAMKKHEGGKRTVEYKGKCEKGESYGIYIISEIAPNVCSILRIQHGNLNVTQEHGTTF